MGGSFELEPIWDNDDFSIRRGVLGPRTTLLGTELGHGVIYYPGVENVAHRTVSESGEEVVSKTGHQLRVLWNPGQLTEIVNYSAKPRDLFLIKLNYSPLLAANVLSDDDAAGAVSYLLHGSWPEAFRSSVEMDVRAIGQLGTTNFWNPFGRTNKAVLRATRAKEDLEFKIAWVAAMARAKSASHYFYRAGDYFPFGPRSKAAPESDGMIKVTVNTKDASGVKDVPGFEVWTNPYGAAADNMTSARRFDQFSTPTTDFLSVGRYAMWVKKGNQKGAPVPIAIGRIDKPLDRDQTIDLVAL